MRNILIIGTNHYNAIGGIERYLRNIMNNINANYYFISTTNELPIVNSGVIENVVSEKNCIFPYKKKMWFLHIFIYWFKMMRTVKSFNVKFDEIIINTPDLIVPKRLFHKAIFVLHFNGLQYFKKGIFRKVFDFFTLRKNLLLKTKKIITFTEYDYEQIPFKLRNKLECQPIISEIEIKEKEICNVVREVGWIGRYNDNQKDISFYSELSEKFSESSFTSVGAGEVEPRGTVKDLGKMSGKEISHYLDSIDVLVMTSNHEGFPFVAAEAISRGVPVVLPNTFPAAKYMTEKYRCGILVEKNIDNYISALKEIPTRIRKADLKKYNNENTIAQFISKWKDILGV